jgi:PST family polysaccharide transporter
VTGAIRAAFLLGGSSIVAIVSTLLTAKVLAVLVGPSGVGIFGLLQAMTELGVLVAGLGVSVSLVRSLADAREQDDAQQHSAARLAAAVLAWSVGGAVALVLIAARGEISRLVLDSSDLAGAVVVAALAVPISLAAAVHIATLSTQGRVGTMAALRSLAAVVLGVTTICAVAFLGVAGSSIGLVVGAATLWLGTYLAIGHGVSRSTRPAVSVIVTAARKLVRFGVPFAASALVGTGIQLIIPILVAVSMGTESAGFYRAATQISAGYLAFVAAAMLLDYYPRLSAQRTRPDVLVRLIDQQLQLVMILTIPLILLGIALADLIVPILYTRAFEPAVAILGWQLAGTLLKLPSWTLAFAVLARGRSVTYFLIELVGGLALLGASVVGMRVLGLPGLGVAVLVTYLIYYPVVWLAVRRDLPVAVTTAQRVLLGTLVAVVAIGLLPTIGLGDWRQPLALLLALASIGAAAVAGRRVLRGKQDGDADDEPPADGMTGGRATVAEVVPRVDVSETYLA